MLRDRSQRERGNTEDYKKAGIIDKVKFWKRKGIVRF